MFFLFLQNESKILDQTSSRFEGKSRVWYKCELEQDVSLSDPITHHVQLLVLVLVLVFLINHLDIN